MGLEENIHLPNRYATEGVSILNIYFNLASTEPDKRPHKVQNEFLKNLPYNWKLFTLCLLNKILKEETPPADWFSTLLALIHKKGDKLDHQNYRGVALVNHLSKLLSGLINNRLTKRIEDNKILSLNRNSEHFGDVCIIYLRYKLLLTVVFVKKSASVSAFRGL